MLFKIAYHCNFKMSNVCEVNPYLIIVLLHIYKVRLFFVCFPEGRLRDMSTKRFGKVKSLREKFEKTAVVDKDLATL